MVPALLSDTVSRWCSRTPDPGNEWLVAELVAAGSDTRVANSVARLVEDLVDRLQGDAGRETWGEVTATACAATMTHVQLYPASKGGSGKVVATGRHRVTGRSDDPS